MATFPFFTGDNIVEKQVLIGDSPFTFKAFLNPTHYEYGIIVSKERLGDPSNQFRLELHADGKIALVFEGIDSKQNVPGSVDPHSWVSPICTAFPIALNKFTHVAIVRNGLLFSLYINGKMVSSATAVKEGSHNNTENLRVGSRYATGSDDAINPFPGFIGGAVFHNQAFTADQIKRSYSFQGQEVGPFGGNGGGAFADSHPVTKVVITTDSDSDYGIKSLQAFYGVWGAEAGKVHGVQGDNTFTFDLGADEVIIGAVVRFDDQVQSIKFITNIRKSETYGRTDRGTLATLSVPPGAAVSGFYGRANVAIDSIGLSFVYMQYSNPENL